jgi:ATP-binding protein involved in chromosome partitioning
MSIREQADSGRPTVVADPDGEIAAIYKAVARTVAVKIAQKAKDFSSKFPEGPVGNFQRSVECASDHARCQPCPASI